MLELPARSSARPLIPEQGSRAMPFMVIYRTSDGVSRYEQAGAIDEAALFVERLRNKDGIDQIRIYRMEEIGFAFRPYYKVELGSTDRDRSGPPNEVTPFTEIVEIVGEPADSPDAHEGAAAEDDAAAEHEVPEVVADVTTPAPPPPPPRPAGQPAAANGRQGLFGR